MAAMHSGADFVHGPATGEHFYHIQGKNGRKSSFLAWPEMPCSPRRVCSGRGERRGIMTATPPYGG
ncbi:hypothetical protein ECLT68_1541 [Escherichia coli LT-68]|nr:hypothetical protein ECLT68_1541 [Escherichia coli LT-68]